MYTEERDNLMSPDDVEIILSDDDDDYTSSLDTVDIVEGVETVSLSDDDDEDALLIQQADNDGTAFLSLTDDEDEDEDSGEMEYTTETGFEELVDDDDDDEDDDIIDSNTVIANPERFESKEIVNAKPKNEISLKVSKQLCLELKQKMIESITNSYNGVITTILKSAGISRGEEMKQSLGFLLKDSPKFMNDHLLTAAMKKMNMFDGTYESGKSIFLSICPDSFLITDINIQLFCDYLKRVKESLNLDKIDVIETDDRLKYYRSNYTNTLFDKQNIHFTTVSELNKVTDSVAVKHVKDLGNGFDFTCNCGHVNHLNGRLFSVVNINETPVLETPMICDKCGSLNLIPSAILKKVKRHAIKFFNNFDFAKRNVDNVIMYYPSFKILEDLAPNVFSSVDLVIPDEEVKVFDKDKFAKEFLAKIEYYHSLKSESEVVLLGAKGLAKILSSISHDYIDLKENALYSLCQFFRTSRLAILGESRYQSSIAYSYYKSDFDKYCDELASCINCKGLDLHTASKEDKLKYYNRYLKDCEDISKYRAQYIEDLVSNAELITFNLPFIKGKLNERDCEDFLSNDKLRETMDYLSDVLIVSHLAEEFLANLKIRVRSAKGDIVNDKKLQTVFRKIRDVNNMDIPRAIGKFINYFSDRAQLSSGTYYEKFNNFLLSSCENFSFLSEVSSIFNNILNCEYYEATNRLLTLNQEFYSVKSKLKANKFFSSIVEVLDRIPAVDITVLSEFDYYFGKGFNYTNEQKSKLLDLFKIKKYKIKLEGNSFEEDYDKYVKSTSSDAIVIDERYDKFIEDNLVILESFRQSPVFKDYIFYTLGRDLLFTMKGLEPDVFAKIFCMNSNIVKLYLEEEFKFPEKSSCYQLIVRDLLYPLDSLEAIKNDQDVSDEEFINNLSSEYKILEREMSSIPKVLDIVREVTGIEK